MAGVKDPALFGLVHDFFIEYLPELKNASPSTIYAYRESLDALLDFVKIQKRISLAEVTFDMIDWKMLTKFLDYLEMERGCSIETRNHRLNRIRAFYKYAAQMDSTVVIHRAEILKVPTKKVEKTDIIEYMSEDALKEVLKQPDMSSRLGQRDQFLMILLYDTGARIQEVVGARLCDIRLSKTPAILLHGKLGKTRIVPLMESTVQHYQNYARIFHPGENAYSQQFMFYVDRCGHRNALHHDTARKFIHSYGVQAKLKCIEVPDNVHPHMFRHSRAMHLYQRGVDLKLISQWLGHVKMETTLIYAKADTEQKRRAMDAANRAGPLADLLNAERCILTDDNLIKQLYGLKR